MLSVFQLRNCEILQLTDRIAMKMDIHRRITPGFVLRAKLQLFILSAE